MADNEEDVDPVEKLLKQTGCLNLHYKVQVNKLSNPYLLIVSYSLEPPSPCAVYHHKKFIINHI